MTGNAEDELSSNKLYNALNNGHNHKAAIHKYVHSGYLNLAINVCPMSTHHIKVTRIKKNGCCDK